MQIDVGKKLRGEITDRQTARAQHGKEVIAGEVDRRILLCQQICAARQNTVDQLQHPPVRQMPLEGCAQHGVVHAGEKLTDIERQHIAPSTRKVLCAVERRQRAFAAPAGVGVVDKARLPDRFDDLTQGVVNDTILERRRRNHAAFPFAHHEGAVAPRLIRSGFEPLLQGQQAGFGIKLIRRDLRPTAFAAPRRQVRRPEVLKTDQPVPEIAKCFRHCLPQYHDSALRAVGEGFPLPKPHPRDRARKALHSPRIVPPSR